MSYSLSLCYAIVFNPELGNESFGTFRNYIDILLKGGVSMDTFLENNNRNLRVIVPFLSLKWLFATMYHVLV